MDDYVRSDNYLEYLEFRIKVLEDRWEARKEEYRHAKNVYEQGRLAKFFGWKFEQSGAWITPNANDEYSPTYECWINEYKSEITRINYQRAMGHTIIAFNQKDFSIRLFYQYCKEKGLP